MTPVQQWVFDHAMVTTVARRRIAILVEPRLLAETLLLALRRRDVEVVIELDVPPGDQRVFDVAVVTDGVPPGTAADVVIRLPRANAGDAGSVTTAEGTEPAALGDLAALLETLDRYLRPV